MRTALEVADIFRRHGAAYRSAHDAHMGRVERRIMGAIEVCRTASLGGHVEACEDCRHSRIAYNSCRNRHCPKCQGLARAEWLADRQADLLPAPYFHVVFTVPAEVAAMAFQNKAVIYAILFQAAAETLRTIAADPRHLGAEIGFIAMLHTWGQTLTHHPHLHCVVPGGGLSPDGARWIACRPNFFLPIHVLSRFYRRLFLERLQAAFDAGRLRFFGDMARLAEARAFAAQTKRLRKISWVVYAKPPFGSHRPGSGQPPAWCCRTGWIGGRRRRRQTPRCGHRRMLRSSPPDRPQQSNHHCGEGRRQGSGSSVTRRRSPPSLRRSPPGRYRGNGRVARTPHTTERNA